MTILHVDMNAFFASVEQAANPVLRNRPIAVIGSKERTVVLAASYAAKLFGVKTGCTVFDARKRCPDIVFVTSDPYKYMDTSTRIMRIFQQYTPLVEVCSIDEAFLDVTGSLYLFGPADGIARKIKQDIRDEFNITCSVGIAPNKLLSKLAANMQKPDGLVEIKADSVPACLRSIPIEDICGIGPRTTKFLNGKGIFTCGQLQQIPVEYLTATYGVIGEWLHRAAFGIDESPVITVGEEEDPKSVGHSMTLLRDVHSYDEIAIHLHHLSEMVGRRLRAGSFSGSTVSVTLRFSSFATITKRKTFGSLFQLGHDIYSAAMIVVKLIPLAGPVRLVGVSVSSLRKNDSQYPLFPEDRRKFFLTLAMDAVNDRYGESTIFPATVLQRHRRERTIAPSWRPHGIRQAIRT